MADSLVVLTHAANGDEARVIQAVLRAAGIPAVVEGDALMDEWAASQRALGQLGSAVKIPASAVKAAETALAEAHESGVEVSGWAESRDDALESGRASASSGDDRQAPWSAGAPVDDEATEEQASDRRGGPSATVVAGVVVITTLIGIFLYLASR